MGILRRLTRRLGAAAGSILLAAGIAAADCTPGTVDIRGDFGAARFRVELARTPEQQARGLMFRESMPALSGMLFVYERSRDVSFWMRNTLIPLDMIFMDARGVVQSVHAEAQPLDETLIFGGDSIQYVLEINGGLAGQLGISEGTELRHPVISEETAAWPCDADG